MKRQRAIEPDEACAVMLVRPLLEVSKARLIATLRARGATWVEDPSNARLDQERPRMRALLARLEHEGLAAPAIARSAERLRGAEEALSFAVAQFTAQVALRIDREIYAQLDSEAFLKGPRLLRERLLTRLIARFGGTTPAPRLSEVEDLVQSLEGRVELRATLGGAVISKGARAVRVWRETGRAPSGAVLLAGAEPRLWDNRFWVSATMATTNVPVAVRPLGADGVAALPADARPKAAPSRALRSLPGFYLGERLISVPTLAYHSHGCPACQAVPVHEQWARTLQP